MKRTRVFSLMLLLWAAACLPAWSVTYTAFGAHGEGGTLNGQTITIGPGGTVYEVDAFLYVPGTDLNGADLGQSARLSKDSMPTGLVYTFSASLTNGGHQLLLTYSFSNSTPTFFHSLRFFSFLDAEIDQASNTFYDEYGTMGGVVGQGSTDAAADSWRIDEPGYSTGLIMGEMMTGALLSSNAVPQASPNDVSMALGFDLGDLILNQSRSVRILISEDGGTTGTLWLTQRDIDTNSATVITLSGAADVPASGTTPRLLVVASAHGGTVPPGGTNAYVDSTVLNCAVTNSPLDVGVLATQYVCAGWMGSGSVPAAGTGTNTGPFSLTNDSAITWQWATNYYLAFATSGSGSVGVTNGWHGAGSSVLAAATAATGWHFTGWSGDTNGCAISGNQITATMSQRRQIQAAFAVDQHTLQIVSAHGTASPPAGLYTNGWGTVLSNRVTGTETRGTTQYLCTGWVLVGNEPLSGASTSLVLTLTNDAVLTWEWKTQFDLTVSAGANGSVAASNGWYNAGSVTSALAVASNGYHFAGWSGDVPAAASNDNPLTLTMNQARSVQASFAVDRHRLVVRSPQGGAVPPVGTNMYDYGAVLTGAVTNSPLDVGVLATQYVCVGWSGSGSVPAAGTGTNTGPFSLTNDSAITWQWQTNYYLALATIGAGSVDVTNGWDAAGSNVLLTATAATGWHFVGWSGATNGCTISGNQILAPMSQVRQIQAVFAVDQQGGSVNTNATSYLLMSFTWQLDRQTGTLLGSLQMSVNDPNAKRIGPPFKLALHGGGAIHFVSPTGTLPDGDPYVDVTTNVVKALGQTGNGDGYLDPGETLTIQGIDVFTPNRAIPPSSLFRLWAQVYFTQD